MPAETIPLFHHDDFLKVTQTPGHPESPDRIRAILDLISRMDFPADIRRPKKLLEADLELVHGRDHVDKIRDFGVGFMDPDTFHHELTYDLALRAAGGVVEATELAVRENRAAFCIPRPPGHHSGPDYNMGFCYFNNVSIAARMALERLDGIQKIAIVDIDAHHGNGTNDTFSEDEEVLYISTHQWGIFPGTGHQNDVGRGVGEGKTVNLPLMGGAGDPTLTAAMDEIIIPILDRFSPDLIMVSVGGDSHIMDPLTSLTLSTPGSLVLTDRLKEAATRLCQGRMIYELEGGYHPKALAEIFVGAMDQHLEEPGGVKTRYTETREPVADSARIRQFTDIQASYWSI